MITILSVNTNIAKESEYLLFLAKELAKYSNYIIACTNADVEYSIYSALQNICDKVCQCDSYFNLVKWKMVLLNELDRNLVTAEDSLLLVDDSCFGPVYSLDILFSDKMKNVDFWGWTEHGEMKLPSGKRWPRFLQSYFLVINNRMLSSKHFWKYFENLATPKNLEDASEIFEFSFTDYFGKLGFTHKAVIDTKERENSDPAYFMSFILFDLYNLIAKKKFPFVPKYIFDIEPLISQNFHLGNDIRKAMEYIEENTDYEISLIYSNLLARLNIYDIQVRAGLNYIPAEVEQIKKNNLRIAVFAYLYYEDLFPYSVCKLSNVPECCDIFIATDSDTKIKMIKEECRQNLSGSTVDISLHKGRGRDLSALLITFKKYLMNYDLVCFIHDKKSSYFPYITVGESFNENIWENLLSNTKYINSIINLFISKPYLGLLSAPMVEHNIYFHTAIDSWTICYEQTKEIANKIGISVNIDKNKNPVALGSAFWCRTKALKPLFEYPFVFEDFPEEPLAVDGTFSHGLERLFPYVAQEQGFCSGTVMTREISEVNLILYRYKLNVILREIERFKGINTDTLSTTVETLKNNSIKKKS